MIRISCFVFLFLYAIAGLPAQENPGHFINDSKVRLRESPTTQAKIIRQLDQNELVTIVGAKADDGQGEYAWVRIQTKRDSGWAFGQYLSAQKANDLLRDIEDAALVVNGSTTYIGMTMNELIDRLGEPNQKTFDDEDKDFTLSYGKANALTLLVHQYNQRLHQIIIKSNQYTLRNGVSIGQSITAIKAPALSKSSESVYFLPLFNALKTAAYDCAIIFTLDQAKKISEIQIGKPE